MAAADVDGGSGGPADQAGTGPGPDIEPADDTVSNQDAADSESTSTTEAPLAVYGDAAYGAGVLLEKLEAAGAQIMTKVQPPVAPGGRFAKDRFDLDLGAGIVTCPAHVRVAIRPKVERKLGHLMRRRHGGRRARVR